jgi:hypothetical protein
MTFAESGLQEIRIPKWVVKIGDCCFAVCQKLTKVEFERIGIAIRALRIPRTVKNRCGRLKILRFEEGSVLEGRLSFHESGD